MKKQLDEIYQFIMLWLVKKGYAPHYTDIAKDLSIEPEEAKKLLHELMALPLPNWLYPQTDLIASFAPFNSLPTQYKISVEGEQKWFAQ